MASSIMHMCIAKEVNKKLKLDENMLLLGSIAPDLSKHAQTDRLKSHFIDTDGVENANMFYQKYKHLINDPFMIGYYTHLYTDYLWNNYFMTDIVSTSTITLLNGDKVDNNLETYQKLIYQDYTNLDSDLIKLYNLDLDSFCSNALIPNIKMDEIPIDKLPLIIDYCKILKEHTKKEKAYTFEINNALKFIELATKLINSEIDKLNAKI